MRNDYEEQPDELEQQQQQQQQPTLPLLYLPVELAEEISMYFERRDAAKLLRVSRSFYSLFLPRVWARLRTFTNIRDDEARRHMLEKYGHFVRIMDFTTTTMGLLAFNWLSFVKNAMYLHDIINFEITVELAEVLIKLIKQSKMLQTLCLSFGNCDTPVKFDELAAAINELKYLKCIKCEFATDYGTMSRGGEWKHAASFIDLLHPTKRSKLQLDMKMKFDTAVNEVDVQTLAPYIVEFNVYGDIFCTADLAGKFFGFTDNGGQPLVFPQLKELKMTSCCFNSQYPDVKRITASRLPQLQRLYFDTGSCNLLEVVDVKCNWQPEYSGYAHIIIPSQRWHCLVDLTIDIVSSSILMDIVGCNPQLKQLFVGSKYTHALVENDASKYNHDEFQLDTILDCLPHLKEFSIGRLNSRLVADPAAIPVTRRYNIEIFIGCQMSIAPSAAAYILQMPQLTNLSFIDCVFVSVDKTIQLLQSSTATCGVKRFQWYPIVWHQELALAVTEKMPRLERITLGNCPEEHFAVFEAKYELRT
ncbi:hypothetical protein GQ42DRAFT_159861, partial [Ramicandelaber brevisporus]